MTEHPPIPDEAIRAAKADADVLGMAKRGVGVFFALPNIIRAVAPVLWRAWTAGKAVVDLPAPDKGDDCWYVGESDLHGYQENGDPAVCHNLATLDSYPPTEARALAAALLAAADRAEQLADEHNAALQDGDLPPDQEWHPRECQFCTRDAALACTDPSCRARRLGEDREDGAA